LNNYRSKIEIVERILGYIARRDKALKTHILYSSNLNTTNLEKYLDWMTKIGLVSCVKEGRNTAYVLTPKGFEVLEKLRNLVELLELRSELSKDDSMISNPSLSRTLGVEDYVLIYKTLKGKTGLDYTHLTIKYRGGEYLVLLVDEKSLSQYSLRSLGYSLLASNDTGLPLLVIVRNKSLVDSIVNIFSTSKPLNEPRVLPLRDVLFV
jgi:predicted transcriptional regulator